MAFSMFFAKKARYPAFKRKDARATARYTRGSFRITDGKHLSVTKIGRVAIRWDRPLPSPPSGLTIVREATGRYYASFVVDIDVTAKPMTGLSVGIDFGLAHDSQRFLPASMLLIRNIDKKTQRLRFSATSCRQEDAWIEAENVSAT